MYAPELVSMHQLDIKGLPEQNFRTKSHGNQRDQILILTFPVHFFLAEFINNLITNKPIPKEIFMLGEMRKSQTETEILSKDYKV